MKNIFLFFQTGAVALFVFILFSCGGSGNKTVDIMASGNDSIIERNKVSVKLKPLKEETLRMKGKDPFGGVIELKGEQIIVDSLILTPVEIEMIIKDNFLVMKSRNKDGPFMLFTLPELRLLKTFGSIGRGPDEFMFPGLCRNTQSDILATVVESTNGKTYDVLPDGTLRPNNLKLPKSKSVSGNGEYPALMTDSLLYFAANSSSGKSVFTAGGSHSIQVNEIQDLALDSKRKGWTNYIGDLAINMEQARMVYAYKYFKIVKFFDLEHHTVRTINFEREEFDENSNYKADGLDSNITNYWGISVGEEHVYMLYIGRTPAQVWSDNQKENHYIFVEKYDWNGQPVAKYKLDQWGYFTVDEKNNLLYLVSTNDDNPFFRYRL